MKPLQNYSNQLNRKLNIISNNQDIHIGFKNYLCESHHELKLISTFSLFF